MMYTYYVDESGNTGTNWLDEEQNFFIYGGWLVNDNEIEIIEKFISEELEKQQGPEFKSSKMFKSSKGAQKAMCFLNYLIDNNCVPFFIITEKKFMVAAKIVESFFDYMYNPNVNARLTYPVPMKRALANCILENDESNLIEDFVDIIKNGTMSIDKIREINNKLIKLFKDSKFEEVSKSLMGIPDEGLREMINEFEVVSNYGDEKTKLTLTEPYLHTIFSKLNFFANNILESEVSIIHDKLRGYDDNFIEMENFFGGLYQQIVMIDKKPMIGNYFRLASLKVEDSKNELLLQMADLLIGFVNNSLKKWRMRDELNKEQQEFWKVLINLHDLYIEDSEPIEIWSLYMSAKMENIFFNSLKIERNIKSEENYRKIINNEYSMYLTNP